jgi:hypothetical protein
MTIVVDSSQWTGEPERGGVPVVWGEFASPEARDTALARLRRLGVRREGEAALDLPANAGQVEPPDENPEEADQRTLRQSYVGLAMAGSAMAAAGLVIASGGAALPAAAAAMAAGAASGTIGEAIGHAAAPEAEPAKAVPPITGPVIGLVADDARKQGRAAALLREAGAIRIAMSL